MNSLNALEDALRLHKLNPGATEAIVLAVRLQEAWPHISDLERRAKAAEDECLEQARIVGAGTERILALMAQLEQVTRERDGLRQRLAEKEKADGPAVVR